MFGDRSHDHPPDLRLHLQFFPLTLHLSSFNSSLGVLFWTLAFRENWWEIDPHVHTENHTAGSGVSPESPGASVKAAFCLPCFWGSWDSEPFSSPESCFSLI